jgi:GNAT superfamily N-acetyltransferase
MNGPVSVRWAEAGDALSLAALLRELHDHYQQPVQAERQTLDAVRRWLQPVAGNARFAIALADGRPAGFAVAAVVWPADGLATAFHMKELFVTASCRGTGVGRAIIGFLAREAMAAGHVRIDLTTEAWNQPAIGFYAALGASEKPAKKSFRFDAQALSRLGKTDS